MWGDKKYVLPALLPEFQGKIDLIYIDPPFVTGADFTYEVEVGGESFTKKASAIEQKAYRDTWGRGLDSYLQWFYETAVVLRDFLADSGSIYVHLDWHVGHYAKVVLDEVFGAENFQNEVVWWYRKWSKSSNRFLRNHDVLYFYSKSAQHKFNILRVPLSPSTLARFGGKRQDYADDDRTRKVTTDEESEGGFRPDVWTQNALPAQAAERTPYPTQKPEALLETVLEASSNPGDLVMDCFVGSGTVAAVAERLGRRWIAADLSRFAVHTTRKRLLSIPRVKPFVIQNLGKYERQAWQVAEFGTTPEGVNLRYRDFILQLYRATPVTGYNWIHGMKSGRAVHVGAVDAPVSPGDVQQMAAELAKLRTSAGSGPRAIDILGWDFAFELNEVGKQQAARARIDLRFFRIPHDVMDKRAVAEGDISFYELAALAVDLQKKARRVTVMLTDFVIPLDDVPEEIQKAVKDWSEWVDYWAIDWDNRNDTFHNVWQSYRSRATPKLERSATHTFDTPGQYTIVVKVIDILGNDTTKPLSVEVK